LNINSLGSLGERFVSQLSEVQRNLFDLATTVDKAWAQIDTSIHKVRDLEAILEDLNEDAGNLDPAPLTQISALVGQCKAIFLQLHGIAKDHVNSFRDVLGRFDSPINEIKAKAGSYGPEEVPRTVQVPSGARDLGVVNFLKCLGLEDQVAKFVEHDVKWTDLISLDTNDVKVLLQERMRVDPHKVQRILQALQAGKQKIYVPEYEQEWTGTID